MQLLHGFLHYFDSVPQSLHFIIVSILDLDTLDFLLEVLNLADREKKPIHLG